MTPRERILSAARRIHGWHGLSGLSMRPACHICCALLFIMSHGPRSAPLRAPDRVAPAAPDLGGAWLATLSTNNVDDFQIYLTLARAGVGRYEAYSRQGALRAMISWRQ